MHFVIRVAAFVAFVGLALPVSAQTLRVTATTTNLRAAATADSAILATLAQGAELDVIAQQGAWYFVRVRVTGEEGFVHSLVVETAAGGTLTPSPQRPGVPAQPPAAAAAFQPVQATQSGHAFTRREPFLSLLLSMVYPGLGQFYNGPTERKKAAILAGIATGSLILAISGAEDCTSGNCGALAGGFLAYNGIAIYSVIDAFKTAGRLNRQHGFALDIRPQKDNGRTGVRASVSYTHSF